MANSLNDIVKRSKQRTVAQNKIKNSGVSSQSGAFGAGDRGAGGFLPEGTGNPYFSQDYVSRWRSYVKMYETSWEARKIIRIVPEDAFRKPWEAQDIPEEMAVYAKHRIDQLGIVATLKKSCMLERLLGGCLSFLGLDGEEDDIETVYHPKDGRKLRFCNAIPVSRVARVDWCHDPLSEHYMRPEGYLINSQKVHVSRTLVWDGEPLFDPFDYALNNFRANLAGFGESKLAPIWDDVIKAVGTRQAAYQMIQTNNAIIMAISDLQDLGGTKPGKAMLDKLTTIANQLSIYKATVVDGEKVNITQSAASFGSVPELMMAYLQILSAASDIPATRFLGQAPGGLNATGDSDLENYYNVIDAYQQQRIVPNVRRVYDILLYEKFGEQWGKERQKLDIKFPPLWNESELELAQRGTATITNTLQLVDAGLMGDMKATQELNSKGVLSVKLDATDISIVDTMELGEETPINGEDEIQKLKNSVNGHTFENKSSFDDLKKEWKEVGLLPKGGDENYTKLYKCIKCGSREGVKIWEGMKHSGAVCDACTNLFMNQLTFDPHQIELGLKDEQEHLKEVDGDEYKLMQIVMDHLKEDPQYYTKLGKAGLMNAIPLDHLGDPTDKQIAAGNYKKHALKLHGFDISIENPRGSIRRGINPGTGEAWESELPAHYGYIKKTMGADGDHVDLYVGDHEDSELVFVVDQLNDEGTFDEHKCIFGCLSTLQAKQLYLDSFSDGRGNERMSLITPMHVEQFKTWISSGDTTKPFGAV